MQTIAEGVQRVALAPRALLNAYLIDGDVLVDAGMPHQARRLLRQLNGIDLRRIVLTHAHVDHAGTVAALSAEKGCEVRCGEADLADLAAGVSPPLRLGRPLDRVQRAIVRYRGLSAVALHDGDEVGGGFVALATPGHTAGHHSLWRESDRVLIVGDSLFGVDARGRARVTAPGTIHRPLPREADASIRRLAELEPALIAFGHGHAIRDGAAAQLSALAASLG